MIRRPPRSTRTDTLLPYTTLCLSIASAAADTLRHVLPTSSHERDAPIIASRRLPVTRLLFCCLALFACILAATTPAAFAARQTAETTEQAPAPPPPTDATAASRQLQATLTTDEDLKIGSEHV